MLPRLCLAVLEALVVLSVAAVIYLPCELEFSTYPAKKKNTQKVSKLHFVVAKIQYVCLPSSPRRFDDLHHQKNAVSHHAICGIKEYQSLVDTQPS